MLKLSQILLEQNRKRIQGKIKVTYREDSTIMDIAEILRAIEDVTIVDTGGGDKDRREAIYDIKFLTIKDPKDIFLFLKRKALQAPEIEKVQIATNTIEFF